MPQIRAEQQPVTQITVVEADPGKQAEALELMTHRAEFMARQPGFVSISLHRSLDGRRIVNYVQWESRDLLAAAHRSPEFRKEWGHFDRLADEIESNGLAPYREATHRCRLQAGTTIRRPDHRRECRNHRCGARRCFHRKRCLKGRF